MFILCIEKELEDFEAAKLGEGSLGSRITTHFARSLRYQVLILMARCLDLLFGLNCYVLAMDWMDVGIRTSQSRVLLDLGFS